MLYTGKRTYHSLKGVECSFYLFFFFFRNTNSARDRARELGASPNRDMGASAHIKGVDVLFLY